MKNLSLLVCLTLPFAAHAGPQEACAYSVAMDGVSCLVMERGKITHEQYAKSGGPDKTWGLASGTKSFSGVAAAAAVLAQSRATPLPPACPIPALVSMSKVRVMGSVAGVTVKACSSILSPFS